VLQGVGLLESFAAILHVFILDYWRQIINAAIGHDRTKRKQINNK
jgi:hypothetical protein